VPGGVGPCTVACLMQNTLLGKDYTVVSIVNPVSGGVGPCTVACLMQNTLLGKDYSGGEHCNSRAGWRGPVHSGVSHAEHLAGRVLHSCAGH
jgi:hypothetical protein